MGLGESYQRQFLYKMINMRFLGTSLFVTNANLMPPKVRMAAEQQLIRFGYTVANNGKIFCPVMTGRLRASVTVNWSGSPFNRAKPVGRVSGQGATQGINDGVGRPEDPKGFWVAVGTNVGYAEEVHDRIPFLWAAFKQDEAKFRKGLSSALMKAL